MNFLVTLITIVGLFATITAVLVLASLYESKADSQMLMAVVTTSLIVGIVMASFGLVEGFSPKTYKIKN